MKKILFALIGIIFVGSLCFAQQPATPTTPAVNSSQPAVTTGNTLIGRIDRIIQTIPKPPKMTYCRIEVASDSGEKHTIWIIKATVITDADGKTLVSNITSFKSKEGKRVEIKYLTAENGRDEATSIHYLD